MARPPRSARPQPRSSPAPPPRSRSVPVGIVLVLLIGGAIAVAWQYLRASATGCGRADLDRYASRRSLAGLRVREGTDACNRRVREGRRRLRSRVQSCAADAASTRVDPHGIAAVRARRARQPWLHTRRGQDDAGGAIPSGGIPDGRIRLGIRAPSGDGNWARLRRLRRGLAGRASRRVARASAAARRADAGRRRKVAQHPARRQVLPVFPHLRAAHALLAAGALPLARAV